ncbi:hypothetical protein EYF80_039462 [Liparis tanakae]|uniref:ALMS motif domain-containing protein n=1 Tax=Liparis tanakae TaxID=230148 RepID=A0A4Z2GCB0_9TELE|nr:hypothetical protein EYF80_039462 [Liparis tanakae]
MRRTWTKQAGSEETEARQEGGGSSEPQKVPEKTSWLKADFLEGTSHNLSLKEALELLRPDFISHSQGRVRRLEQRARRRRCMHGSHPDLVEGLGEDRGKEKRNCTTPDPHSGSNTYMEYWTVGMKAHSVVG